MIVLPDNAIDAEHGRIGWRNLVASTNIVASSAAAGFPALNLANPTTFQLWRAAAAGSASLTTTFAAQAVDYVGIARHNLGSAGIGYTLQGTVNGTDWTNLADPQAPTDDSIIIHEFAGATLMGVRVQLGAGTAPAQAAVLHVGAITRLQRRIYVGHTPLNFGRQTAVSTGMSESGQFLGRVTLRRQYATQIVLNNIDPAWYRDELDGFSEAAAVQPFFWAWRPAAYPAEVGYAWVTDDPVPSNDRANGMMGWSVAVQGIVR